MSPETDEEYAERLRADPSTWEWVAWARERIRSGDFERAVAEQPDVRTLVAEIKARRERER